MEGLDYAAELQGNLIIVVNDNDMSIAENHGGMYENLKLLRETKDRQSATCLRPWDFLMYMWTREMM